MKMSCYPESAIDFHLNGLPVDFTAKSIVYLSRVKTDVYGNIYHVMNPNIKVGFEDIIDGMRWCGIELESVSNDEWKMKLNTMNDQHSSLKSIGKFFSDSAFRERSIISADRFCNAVSTLNCPSFDKDYISKCLSFILYNIVRK